MTNKEQHHLLPGPSAVPAFNPRLLVTAVAMSVTLPQVAAAQEGQATRSSGMLEEVTVTAQKRSQSIQDVGIAISAFSGDQLKDFGFNDSIDIAKMTPNVAVSGSYAGQMSQFTIRGVTQNDFNDHVESVIAVYIDEGYVAMQQGQTFSMFDVDRVEVLKGPQGTLFGRNATGGLVHFLSKRPTEEFEAFLDLSYGSYDETRIEGAVSGALGDGVRGRLSGLYHSFDGFLDNVYPNETFVPPEFQDALNSVTLPGAGDDLAGQTSWALRGHLEFDVTDRGTLLLTAVGAETEGSIGPYQQVPSMSVFNAAGDQVNTVYPGPDETCEALVLGVGCANGTFDNDPEDVTRPVPGRDFFGYLDPDGSDFTTSSDYAFDDFNTYETYGLTVNFTYDFDAFTLTSITDYKDFDKKFGLDLEAAPVNQFFWIGEAETESFTQELRLDGVNGPLTWVAGAYFLGIDNESVHGIGALPDSAFHIPSWDQPRVAAMETRSYSLFGQVEYELSPQWSVIAGLRGTKEEKDYDFEVLFVFPNDDGDPLAWDYEPAIPFPGFSRDLYQDSIDEDLWTWKMQLEYRPTDDLLVYGGISQGVKASSFNAGAATLLDEEIPYDEETLISYELGMKSTWLGGKVRFNAAAFYYDYEDYQASRWTGIANQIVNADATIMGAEFDLTASVTSNFDVMIAAGYQDNEVEDVPFDNRTEDVETTFAPEWTASAMAKYYFPMRVADGELSLQVDVSYQDEVWHNLTNYDATTLDSWTVWNARLSWLNAEGDLRIDVFGRNITDEVYDVIGFDLSQVCGCNLQAQGRPEWWGVSLRKDF
ncbi:TonB-dependent receptor [Pseudohaliea sp.]|uniref:TonB-dependent receptor n=1 Tax=Pseudohaliea sp. TaxID=2740289 RepID=UPI0032EDAAEF